MVQFYFKNLIPTSYVGDYVREFEDSFRQYINLIRLRPEYIEHVVVTGKMPSDIHIQNETLRELIFKISDKELLKLAISAFSKYPINNYLSPDIWEEDPLDWEYEFADQIVDDLYFASRMGWILLSIPVVDYLRTNEITITHKIRQDLSIQIPNSYGQNIYYVLSAIDKINGYKKSAIEELKEDVFNGYNCFISKEFEQNYVNQQEPARRLINKYLKSYKENGWLFPYVKADDLHIKSCQGKEVEGLYEGRSKTWNGLRIYFEVNNDTIYLGDVQTKAHVGVEQTNDMIRSKTYIDNIKSKVNKQ